MNDEYYKDICPACNSAARDEDLIDSDNDRIETVCRCTNPICIYFDADNLGPEKLIKFVEAAQAIAWHVDKLQEALPLLKIQADAIARMGMVKVETLIKKQKG